MADPWLTIIGIGENGLSWPARAAIAEADSIFGGPRHLELAEAGERGRAWPVPFSVDPVLAERGRKTVVLASGDPFWFGAGSSLVKHLEAGEWVALPAPSTFSHAAARLGWRLEETHCLGLHAAPFERLVPVLSNGVKAICLVRDGAAANHLAHWLEAHGFGASEMTVLEALGGPRERVRTATAETYGLDDVAHPVAVAIDARGKGGIPRASGLPDALFAHDGQITKRPVRALTLSALAPRPGEVLWDIGAGSGSVSIEWLLAASGTRSFALEAEAERAERAAMNGEHFGLGHRLTLVQARAPEGLADLPKPDAVFIGGGASDALFTALFEVVPEGTRIVANAVTLETEALLACWSAEKAGTLLRIELAESRPLGSRRGWRSAMPVVQWSVTR